MILINKERLLHDIDTQLNASGYTKEIPKLLADSFTNMVERQPEVKIPERREPETGTQSGYWFDKGWNAFREELLNG